MVHTVVKIKVVPRSSLNTIVGFEGDILKVRVKSAPVDGSANRDLVLLLAKHMRVAKKRIEILSGHTSRLKMVRFHGIEKDDVFRLING